jgi:hypothetical protein
VNLEEGGSQQDIKDEESGDEETNEFLTPERAAYDFDATIMPKYLIHIECAETEKQKFLVIQNKPTNESFFNKPEYSKKLSLWRTINEDSSKLSVLDFFDSTHFDVLQMQNTLGTNLFEKAILFMERHGKFSIYQTDVLRPIQNQIAQFEIKQSSLEEVTSLGGEHSEDEA